MLKIQVISILFIEAISLTGKHCYNIHRAIFEIVILKMQYTHTHKPKKKLIKFAVDENFFIYPLRTIFLRYLYSI